MDEPEVVRYGVEHGLGVITLDRPKVNAYEAGFHTALRAAISAAESDGGVSAVVLRSARPGFFCVGADVKAWSVNPPEANAAMVAAARANANAIAGSAKIFVAHLAGHTLGGGLELALACDLVVAEPGGYQLGLPEVKLGLMPGNGGVVRLVHRVGGSTALRLAATGASLNPEEALAAGLIDELGSPDALLATLAGGPREALASIKRAADGAAASDADAALDLEAELADRLADTPDAQEGAAAFVEKRAPRFGRG